MEFRGVLFRSVAEKRAILSGKMRMEELPVSLEQVLREAVETVRPMAAARNIEIGLDFHDWQNEIVIGDRTRLVQVFWNLLHNAAKFSSPGGRVEVDVEGNKLQTTVRI